MKYEYENSLTASVEAYISQVLTRKIAEANSDIAMYKTVREIRGYLCDISTINTPDFVLRRYIQSHLPKLMEDCSEVVDLKNNKNVPWPDEVVWQLAKKLSKLSLERHGWEVSATIWKGYLSGAGARKRSQVFRIAFVLEMSVEDTIDLLLAFNMEPYSVRSPMDLVCMFCQKVPRSYTWQDVESMLEDFENKKTILKKSDGYLARVRSQDIKNELDRIFEQNLSQANAKEVFVEFMAKNRREFRSFTQKKKEIYLPGYSEKRLERFLYLTKCLSIFYPEYINSDSDEPVRYKNLEDGYPQLYGLSKAMFQSKAWNLQEEKKKNKENLKEGEEKDTIYHKFISHYLEHMMGVDRLRKNGREVDFFERRDALIFAYFFIKGYLVCLECMEYEKESYEKIKALNSIICGDDGFEEALNNVVEVLKDRDEENYYDCMVRCLNLILTQLGYREVYVPAPLDRFVLVSLLGEADDELSTVILHAVNMDSLIGKNLNLHCPQS